MNECQRDEILLQVSTSVASIQAMVEQLQVSGERNAEKIDELRESVISLTHKSSEHSTKIISIEGSLESQSEWRYRITGMYIGIVTLISMATVAVTIYFNARK